MHTLLSPKPLLSLKPRSSLCAGHDENEAAEKQGPPLDRMLKMATAMLDAVRTFKIAKNRPLRIRVGEFAIMPAASSGFQ